MKRQLFLFLFALFAFPTLAQERYKPGYIVSLNGDTLKGHLLYEDWEHSPVEVRFKNPDGEVKTLTPTDIKAFFVEKENYETLNARILQIADMAYATPPQHYEMFRLFSRRMWKGGDITLYLVQIDGENKQRLLIQRDGEPVELNYFRYKRMINGKLYYQEVSEYQDQLATLTSDVPGFSAKVKGYSPESVVAYLEAYALARNSGTTSGLLKREKTRFAVGLGAGAEMLNSDFTSGKPKLSVGLTARLNFPRAFYNTFLKVSYFVTPGITTINGYNGRIETGTGRAAEITFGRYIGRGNIQPFWNIGLGAYSGNMSVSGVIFPALGIAYKKSLEIDVSHFINFWGGTTENSRFFMPARVAVHYYYSFK